MSKRENNLDSIAKHVSILNEELGVVKIDITELKNDIKWIKKVMGYMAPLLTAIFITVFGAAFKYIFLS